MYKKLFSFFSIFTLALFFYSTSWADKFDITSTGEGGYSAPVKIGIEGNGDTIALLPPVPDPPTAEDITTRIVVPEDNTLVPIGLVNSSVNKYGGQILASGATEYAWLIAVLPNGDAFSTVTKTSTLSWDVSTEPLGSGTYQMIEGSDTTGTVAVSDMKTTATYDVSGNNSEMKFFTIVFTPTVNPPDTNPPTTTALGNGSATPSIMDGKSVVFKGTISDTATGGSNIDAAEYYVIPSSGTAPAEGSGIALTGTTAFDSPEEAFELTLTSAEILSAAGITSPTPLAPVALVTVGFRGKDAASSNWGTAVMVNVAITIADALAPVINMTSPVPTSDNVDVTAGNALDIVATLDDSATGGSNIASFEYSLDNGTTWTALGTQTDLDSAKEIDFPGTIPASELTDTANPYTVQLQATDSATTPNKSAITSFTVTVKPAATDTEGPVITLTSPAGDTSITAGNALDITATLDDSGTGNSYIASFEYSLDNGTTWTDLGNQADLGDSPTETGFTGTIPASELTGSSYTVQLRATDSVGNPSSTSFTVTVQATGTDTTPPVITKVMSNGLDVTNGNTLVTLDTSRTPPSADVMIEVSASDENTGGSNIVAAEYFLNSPSPEEGSGIAISFTPAINVSISLPVSNLEFATGNIPGSSNPGHIVHIRVKDEAGLWSGIKDVNVLMLPGGDTLGPVIHNLMLNGIAPDTTATPNKFTATSGATAELTAIVSDATTGSSTITTVKYTIDDTDPTTNATALVMTAVDGAFDEITEDVKLSLVIPTADFVLKIAGQDATSKWGDIVTYNVTVCESAANFTYVINATDPMAIDFDLTGTDAGTSGTVTLDYGDVTTDTITDTSVIASHTYATAGTYHVILTSTDASGCAVKMAKDVVVNTPCGKLGDVNNDGEVDVLDAYLVALLSVGSTDPAIVCPAQGDVNKDTFTDIVDALMIAEAGVGCRDENTFDPATGNPCNL